MLRSPTPSKTIIRYRTYTSSGFRCTTTREEVALASEAFDAMIGERSDASRALTIRVAFRGIAPPLVHVGWRAGGGEA